jgi:hypothetical protein
MKRLLLFGIMLAGIIQQINAQTFTSGNLAALVVAASASNTTGSIIELGKTANQTTPVHTFSIPSSGTDSFRFSGSATSTCYVANTNDGSLLAFTGHLTTNTSSNVNTILPRGVGAFNASGTFARQTTYTGATNNQTRCATSVNDTAWYIGDQSGLYTNSGTTASPTGNFRGVKSFGGIVYGAQASSTSTTIQVGTFSAATGGSFTGLPGLTNNANIQDFYLVSSGSNGTTYDILYVLSATSNTAGTIAKYSLVSGSWTANNTYTTTFGGFGLAAEKSGSNIYLYLSTGQGALTANSVVRVTDAAGYNSNINVTTANNLTLYTAATGTIIKGVAFAPISLATLTTSNATGLSSLNTTAGTASSPGSFDVSGSNLTNNVTITSNSANFEISTSSSSGYASSLTLTPSSGTLATTTIYVRSSASASAGTNNSTISVTSTGATSPTPVAVSGTVTSSSPSLSVSTNSLSGFSTVSGTASAQQSFTVSGGNLTNNATVSVTGPYEISTTSGSGFSTSSITLTQSGGSLSGQPVTIYVRIAASASVGAASGSVTIASSPASSQTVTLSGTVTAPAPVLTVTPTSLSGFSTIVGTASATQTFTVSGSNLTNNVTVTPPSKYEISFDSISFFSTAQTITQSGGSLPGQPVTVYVRLSASAAAGTANGSITVSSTGATSQTVALTGTVLQPSLTASPTSLTGFSASLGSASSSQSFSLSGSNLTTNASITVSSGSYEVSLDNINFAASQSITPSSGTIASTNVYVRISASAAGGTANGNVQVTATGATTQNVTLSGTVTGPAISATPTSLSGLNTIAGTASASQSFSASGTNLSTDITVTPSAGLEVSTDNITFSSSLTLTPTSGTVSSTTVYVRVASGASAGPLNGYVALTSTNASTINVTALGYVSAASGSFTGGNIVVVRVGDGVSTLANTGNPVYLDEYTPAGALVNTITLPSAAASNLVLSGSAASEGMLNRSANGKYLTLSGYNVSIPYASSIVSANASAVNRVVGRIDYAGNIDVSTSLTDYSSGNNPRDAYTTDGTTIYMTGAGDARYTTLGSTTSAALTSTNLRAVNIAESSSGAQLYASTGSGSTLRIATIGSGLPTTSGQSLTNLPGLPTSGSPYQFFFADENTSVAGVDVLYVADDAAGILKYSLVSGSWTSNGTVGTGSDGYRGLTGVVDNSTSPATVTLYATSASSGGTSKLVKISDATGYNASFSSSTVTTLVTMNASTKQAFRGVALAPFNSTSANNTFVGGASANFGLGLNYGSGSAPTSTTNAIVPSTGAGAMETPVISSTGNSVQNLTINSGAYLKMASGGALSVSGTITNNGTFSTTAGDLTFNAASGTQQVPALTANNLTFNGSAFSIAGNMTVNGTLSFTAGVVNANGFTIAVSNNATSAVSGGSSSSYLSGGILERVQNNSSSSAYFYPVGAGGKYRPVRLTNGSVTGSNTFDVEYFAITYSTLAVSNASYHASSLEYWDISRTAGATSDPMNVSLISDNKSASGITVPATVEVGHFNGTNWNNLGNNSGNTTFGASGAEITTTGVTSFSPFTFMSSSTANPLSSIVLPIRIESFDARKTGDAAALAWKLGNCSSGEQITLQRSTDGRSYNDIYNMAAGSAEITGNYVDANPARGLNLYRLKVEAKDGSAAYSEVQGVSFSADAGISVYPNPAHGMLNVQYSGTQTLHCELWNASGVLMLSQDFSGGTPAHISVSHLPAGSYWMQMQHGDERSRVQVTILP